MRYCPNCENEMPAPSTYCSQCGAKQIDIEPNDNDKPTAKSTDLYISNGRVILASIFSSGLYFIYWSYLTWKHLAQETDATHYPVWHGLSFLMPIYGLFSLHKHFLAINNLASSKGVDPLLTPTLAVVQIGLVWMISLALLQTSLSAGTIMLMNLIGLALTTVVPTLGQGTLNKYWDVIHEKNLQPAKFSLFEIAIIGFGIFNWVGLLRTN